MHLAGDGLWDEFARTRSAELKRELVARYIDLVRYVAGRFAAQMKGSPHGLEAGDIMQYGMLGLLEAIDRFSPVKGVKFETFAVPRVRGAILDEIRQLDWVPRSVRAAARRADRAARQVAQETGREALDNEIAGRLGISLEEYHQLLRDRDARILPDRERSFPGGDAHGLEVVAEDAPDPLEQLSGEEAKGILIQAIESLPDRERLVITLYYYEGLKFGEIGKVLRVTESRISQIHAGVLRHLRRRLGHLQ